MTVESATASASYTGNGVTAIFPVPFYFLVDTDLKVTRKSAATGVISTLVLNSDYTLTGAGNSAGGSLTSIPALPNLDEIYIERNVTAVQETAYPSNGPFPAASHERALDRLTMLIQQILAKLTFGLFRDPLTSTYDIGGNTISNVADAVNPQDVPSLAQTQTLVTGAATGIVPGLIVKFTDLAASAGASLIGFIQSGTGAVLHTLQDKARESSRTPQDYGAIGDGVTDDTAAVQAWVNACQTYGYKGYVPAVASGYKLTAPINITQGLQIWGDGCEPYTGTVPSTGTATRGRGSWFHLAHAGIGFYVNGGANGRSGVKMANIATYRDQPAPTGGAYTPGVFDYDIVANQVDITIEDVMLLNPTKGISHTNGGYGRLTIRGLRGQPLSIGVNVSESYDTGRVQDVHFWPFWTSDAGVKSYILSNGIAFNLARWDNPDFTSCFAYGYGYFFKLIQNANGKVGKMAVSNCDLDVGGYFLYIDATVSGAQVQLVNCRTQGATSGSFPANFANVQLMGSNCRVVMTNTELRYPQGSCVRVQGSNNTVHMANMTLGGWNQALSTYTAVDAATSGNTIRVNTPPLVSEAGGSGTLLYHEASGATVRALLASGVAPVTTITGGYATITHNSGSTARLALLSTQGGTPYFVQATSSLSTSSTTFDVQVFAAGGAAVAAGVNLNVFWELRF